MALTNKVALDTNMLLAIKKLKIDVFEEIKESIGKAEFLIPVQVIKEMQKLSEKNKNLEKASNIALQLIKKNKAKEIQSKEKDADKALIELAKKGIIIATNDKELKKKVLKVKGKILNIRKRKKIE
ncbi:MAG TPA: hypothetical protein VJK05_01535 [archaeon]|nr:hypothetical protein [archaeon]